MLGLQLWHKQLAILADLQAGYKRLACRSGQKTGKTMCAAIIALWWLATRRNAKVLLTAPTFRQVKDILWRQFTALYRQIAEQLGETVSDSRVDPATGILFADGRSIAGVSTNEPEQLQGYSGAELLEIVDEGSGFDDSLFESVQGNAVGGGTIITFGNPNKTSGWFYDIFRNASAQWRRHHMSSLETPNVTGEGEIPGLATPDDIERMRLDYGEDSNAYRIRVLGEFPSQSDDSVVSIEHVTAAQRRWMECKDPKGPLRIGLDVAAFGDDETVIAILRGDYCYPLKSLRKADGEAVANFARQAVAEVYQVGDGKVTYNVDVIGWGSAAVTALRMLGEQVCAVNVAEKADQDDYPNLRSQLWFGGAQWLRDGGMIPPDDRHLESDLLAPRWRIDTQGRKVVEKKEDIKKRRGRSPDKADALNLAIYRGRTFSTEITTGGETQSSKLSGVYVARKRTWGKSWYG